MVTTTSMKLFISLLFSMNLLASERIIFWERIKTFDVYKKLLIRSMEVTEKEYGSYDLVGSKFFEQREMENELFLGKEVHIASIPPSEIREKLFIPVYIPLTRGLLGLRVCLINKEDKKLFESIENLDDFKKKIKMVVGSSWPDRDIYLNNHLDVIESEKYINLFPLTKKNKGSCFSRSINEVFSELKNQQFVNLYLDKSILLQYNLPTYFFVTKKKPNLAKRVKKGLSILLSTGEYYEIFWKTYAYSISEIDIKHRKIFHLKNSNSLDTKKVLSNKKIWLPFRL